MMDTWFAIRTIWQMIKWYKIVSAFIAIVALTLSLHYKFQSCSICTLTALFLLFIFYPIPSDWKRRFPLCNCWLLETRLKPALKLFAKDMGDLLDDSLEYSFPSFIRRIQQSGQINENARGHYDYLVGILCSIWFELIRINITSLDHYYKDEWQKSINTTNGFIDNFVILSSQLINAANNNDQFIQRANTILNAYYDALRQVIESGVDIDLPQRHSIR
jgi:hypothetical protein